MQNPANGFLARPLAALFPFSRDEGSAAEKAALCSAAIFSLGLLPQLKPDFVSFATVASIVFAGAAAWFWLVSEHPPEVSRVQIAGSLGVTLLLCGIFGGGEAGVHIYLLTRR